MALGHRLLVRQRKMPACSKIFEKRHFFPLTNTAYSTKLDETAQTEVLIAKARETG